MFPWCSETYTQRLFIFPPLFNIHLPHRLDCKFLEGTAMSHSLLFPGTCTLSALVFRTRNGQNWYQVFSWSQEGTQSFQGVETNLGCIFMCLPHSHLSFFWSCPSLSSSYWSERPSSTGPQITNVGEDVEKGEPSYIVGVNGNWYSHYGNSASKNEK